MSATAAASQRAISTVNFLLAQDDEEVDAAGPYRKVWDAAKKQVITVACDDSEDPDPCCAWDSCLSPSRHHSHVPATTATDMLPEGCRSPYQAADTGSEPSHMHELGSCGILNTGYQHQQQSVPCMEVASINHCQSTGAGPATLCSSCVNQKHPPALDLGALDDNHDAALFPTPSADAAVDEALQCSTTSADSALRLLRHLQTPSLRGHAPPSRSPISPHRPARLVHLTPATAAGTLSSSNLSKSSSSRAMGPPTAARSPKGADVAVHPHASPFAAAASSSKGSCSPKPVLQHGSQSGKALIRMARFPASTLEGASSAADSRLAQLQLSVTRSQSTGQLLRGNKLASLGAYRSSSFAASRPCEVPRLHKGVCTGHLCDLAVQDISGTDASCKWCRPQSSEMESTAVSGEAYLGRLEAKAAMTTAINSSGSVSNFSGLPVSLVASAAASLQRLQPEQPAAGCNSSSDNLRDEGPVRCYMRHQHSAAAQSPIVHLPPLASIGQKYGLPSAAAPPADTPSRILVPNSAAAASTATSAVLNHHHSAHDSHCRTSGCMPHNVSPRTMDYKMQSMSGRRCDSTPYERELGVL